MWNIKYMLNGSIGFWLSRVLAGSFPGWQRNNLPLARRIANSCPQDVLWLLRNCRLPVVTLLSKAMRGFLDNHCFPRPWNALSSLSWWLVEYNGWSRGWAGYTITVVSYSQHLLSLSFWCWPRNPSVGRLASRTHNINHFISQRERLQKHIYLKADQAKRLTPFLLQVPYFLCSSLPCPTCASPRSKSVSSEAATLL